MPVAIPTVGWAEVRVTEVRRQGRTTSPYTGQAKVYVHPAPPRYALELRTRPFAENDANAATWRAFFSSLNGMDDTFTMNISRYVPGSSGLTNVSFRLTDPNTGPFGFGKRRVFVFELEALSE